MHYYNFHIKDYRAKTSHLTPLEHYVYRTLIDWYYLSEKPFESIEQIARYLLLPMTDENTQAIKNVLDEFFHHHKGKYHHKRINQEIKNYRHKNGNEKVTDTNATDNEKVTDGNGIDNGQGNAKSNGNALSTIERQARYKERKKMVKALSDKGVTLDGNASFDDVCNAYNAHFAHKDNETANATDNEKVTQNNGKNDARTNNHKPITINHNDISPQTPQGAGVIDTDKTDETSKIQKTNLASKTDKTLNVSFDEFWDAYDKKIDPKKCKPLWERLSDQDRLDIMAYLPKYKQSQPDKQFRKNPQTFLNARSWESEIITQNNQGNYNATHQPNYQPHPNSTEAYAIRLSREINELKRELYPEKHA